MTGYQNKTFWVHLVEILHNKNKLKGHHFWIMVFFGNSGKKKYKKKDRQDLTFESSSKAQQVIQFGKYVFCPS